MPKLGPYLISLLLIVLGQSVWAIETLEKLREKPELIHKDRYMTVDRLRELVMARQDPQHKALHEEIAGIFGQMREYGVLKNFVSLTTDPKTEDFVYRYIQNPDRFRSETSIQPTLVTQVRRYLDSGKPADLPRAMKALTALNGMRTNLASTTSLYIGVLRQGSFEIKHLAMQGIYEGLKDPTYGREESGFAGWKIASNVWKARRDTPDETAVQKRFRYYGLGILNIILRYPDLFQNAESLRKLYKDISSEWRLAVLASLRRSKSNDEQLARRLALVVPENNIAIYHDFSLSNREFIEETLVRYLEEGGEKTKAVAAGELVHLIAHQSLVNRRPETLAEKLSVLYKTETKGFRRGIDRALRFHRKDPLTQAIRTGSDLCQQPTTWWETLQAMGKLVAVSLGIR